jgi:hypothetical protein
MGPMVLKCESCDNSIEVTDIADLSSTSWAWSMNYASGDLLFAKCPDCQKADETLNEVEKDKEDN